MPGRHRPLGSLAPTRRLPVALPVAVAVALAAVIVALLASSASGGRTAAGHRPSRPPSTQAAAASSPASTSPAFTPPASTPAASRPRILAPIPGGPTGPAHASLGAPAAAGVPVRIEVPSIKVSSGLQPLGLLANGALQQPSQWDEAGWYSAGTRPGDPGPAVIAGHVDSQTGPAVFYRLRDLRAGATVLVTDAAGVTRHFIVDDARSYPKDQFPTDAVYGPTPDPQLRLVTCTGDFDFAARSYLDNLVVFAHLAG